VSSTTAWLDVATVTRLGTRLATHHLSQRGLADADRGIIAVIRGYGGQASGMLAADVVAGEIDLAAGVDGVKVALANASRRLPGNPHAQGLYAAVTAIVFGPPLASVVHIGAGRAYRVRSGVVHRLTEDHVRDLGPALGACVTLGRALGWDEDHLDAAEVVLDAGDRFIVVDDTVASAVSDAELVAAVEGDDASVASEALVALAHDRVAGASATAAVAVVRRVRERL
jgi:serine/threonine protein phosphatase PrpC